MNNNDYRIVYHIALKDSFIHACIKNSYQPDDFASVGFIHCSGEPETTMLVLEDYFHQATDEILILKIASNKLTSTIKFEEPAPSKNAGTSHIKERLLFPHIYGPLNLDAIIGAAIVKKKSEIYIWPEEFIHIDNYLKKLHST